LVYSVCNASKRPQNAIEIKKTFKGHVFSFPPIRRAFKRILEGILEVGCRRFVCLVASLLYMPKKTLPYPEDSIPA
jgi:hypothetical protein